MVNVLGRNVEARIGAIRRLDWETLGINFVMVFSPDSFRGAPVTHLATLSFADGASVETEPSIRPARPGCTTCNTNNRLACAASFGLNPAWEISSAV